MTKVSEKLRQLSNHCRRIRQMMFAILEDSNIVENFSKKSLEEKKQWLRNFVKKHVKFILITTNISREEWNTQLQTEAVKRELASKTNEALENCYLMVSENCKVSTAQVSTEDCSSFNRVNKLMKNGGDSKEIILESSETTLKDLLCALPTSSHSDGDEEMLRALRYLGTILVSGHIFQYHRGVLVPTGKNWKFFRNWRLFEPCSKICFFVQNFMLSFYAFAFSKLSQASLWYSMALVLTPSATMNFWSSYDIPG